MNFTKMTDIRAMHPSDMDSSAMTTGFTKERHAQGMRRRLPLTAAPFGLAARQTTEPKRAVWSTEVATGLPFRRSPHTLPDAMWLPNPGLTEALAAPSAARQKLTMCPITHEAIDIPVQLATPVVNERKGPYWQGVSYEKAQLCSWLAFSSTSPLTGEKLMGEARLVVNLGLSDCLRLSRGEPAWDLKRKGEEAALCRAWRASSGQPQNAGLHQEADEAEARPDVDGDAASPCCSGLWGCRDVPARELLLHILVGVLFTLSLAQANEKWSLITEHLAVQPS